MIGHNCGSEEDREATMFPKPRDLSSLLLLYNAITSIKSRCTNVRYFGLENTARLVEREDNQMPTEVAGERQHQLNNVLFWLIPVIVVLAILTFAFLR